MDTACISARAGANHTVSTMPAATDTAPSVSTTKPRSGFIPNLSNTFQVRTSSSPFPSLRPSVPSPLASTHGLSGPVQGSSAARKRLATDARCIGTHLPGCTGVLHPWGRQLQYHPHLHSHSPGRRPLEGPRPWRPSRDHFFVPVQALAPLSRAVFTDDMTDAGLLDRSDPPVWATPWNVHRLAHPHGHPARNYLAPSVLKVALSNSRLVSLPFVASCPTCGKPLARYATAGPHTGCCPIPEESDLFDVTVSVGHASYSALPPCVSIPAADQTGQAMTDAIPPLWTATTAPRFLPVTRRRRPLQHAGLSPHPLP